MHYKILSLFDLERIYEDTSDEELKRIIVGWYNKINAGYERYLSLKLDILPVIEDRRMLFVNLDDLIGSFEAYDYSRKEILMTLKHLRTINSRKE